MTVKFGPPPTKVLPKECLAEIVEQEYLLAKETFDKLPCADQYETVVKYEFEHIAQIKASVDHLVLILHSDRIVIGRKEDFLFEIKREKKGEKSKSLFIANTLINTKQEST